LVFLWIAFNSQNHTINAIFLARICHFILKKNMNIYDSHTHLNQNVLFPQWKEILSQFIEHGGKGLVNAWANEFYNENGLTIAKEAKVIYPDCFVKCALGFHPDDVSSLEPLKETLQNLKELILKNNDLVVAIGECGIDLHWDMSEKPLIKQQEFLSLQCELAKELHLPLMIHSRDAFQETFDIIKQYTDLTIYVHCRWYGPNEIEEMLNTFNHLFIGFCWNVTYPSAQNLRDSVKKVPLNQLLIETDAPYLSPQWHRWEMNTPDRVEIIWAAIANYLWLDEKNLWEQVEKNFFALYSK